MATAAAPPSEGPVLKLLRDRLRLLRKRRTRITQMEERVVQGKVLNSDQEEILNSKPVVTALIAELEALRSAARPEALSASKSAPEKPPQDGEPGAAGGADSVAAPEPVPETVTEPVPETQLQVDAAATDSQQKDDKKPETGGQQQNMKQKDGHGYQNGGSRHGGRGGRGGYPNGRGYHHYNQFNPRYFEHQNRGQLYDNGHNQVDLNYESHGGRNYNPGYQPRVEWKYRNAEGEYNDRGYYNTRGRGAGRGGGYVNRGPNHGPNVSSAEQV